MSNTSTERRLELPGLDKTNLNKTINTSQTSVKERRLGSSKSEQSAKFKKFARVRTTTFNCGSGDFREMVKEFSGIHSAGGGGGEREKGLGYGDENEGSGNPCGAGFSQLTFLPNHLKLLSREKSISDQPVASSVESSISLGSGLCSRAAEDQKEVKPFFGISLLHTKAGHVMNEVSLLSDLTEEENVMVSSEAEKLEAMQKQRAESDFVQMQNTGDTETELFPWLVKKGADPYDALEKFIRIHHTENWKLVHIAQNQNLKTQIRR